jgi:hypothetical protein
MHAPSEWRGGREGGREGKDPADLADGANSSAFDFRQVARPTDARTGRTD